LLAFIAFSAKYLSLMPENESVALTFVLQKFSTTTFKEMRSSKNKDSIIELNQNSARSHQTFERQISNW
tara:strand:+ start:245 stop:451 length:207 start_codon:yes stop_codon:yes gene_type:complete